MGPPTTGTTVHHNSRLQTPRTPEISPLAKNDKVDPLGARPTSCIPTSSRRTKQPHSTERVNCPASVFTGRRVRAVEMTEQYRYRCLAVAWCNHCAISVISPLCRSDNYYTRGVRGEDEECAAVLKVQCGAHSGYIYRSEFTRH
jgi:hypothetical protein